MIAKTHRFIGYTLALVVGAAVLFVSEKTSFMEDGLKSSTVEARIGRPLTPMSYAGVARRTTRRAVVAGAAVGGAVYVAPVVVAPTPGCVQVVNAYGQVYWQC
jgi:hypothetical protein